MQMPKILVVDDQKGVCRLITEALGGENYQVFAVGGGLEALALLQRIEPDLILLDMNMPGMNGLEVNKEIAVLNPAIPVVMTTAYGDTTLLNKAKEAGIQYFLPKPFDVFELRKLIADTLSLRLKKVHA